MVLLKMCSFNTRGIRDILKRRKLFHYLHRHNFDVIFLQETHSLTHDSRRWENEWGGKTFFSHGSNQSRGVATLLNPRFSSPPSLVLNDENGRYVILIIDMAGYNICFVNIYGPNLDHPFVFNCIDTHLGNVTYDSFFGGGDFNFVWNLEVDKRGGRQATNFNARAMVANCVQTHNLIDIWRDRNPHSRRYTWHSNVDESIHCRLDFFLISSFLKTCVIESGISPIFGSDHDSITIEILLGNPRGPGVWKLNTSFLSDDTYCELIRNTVCDTLASNTEANPSLLWELCKLNIRSVSIGFSTMRARFRKIDERNFLEKIQLYEQLYSTNPSHEIKRLLQDARAKLDHFYDFKLNGIIIRSRARLVEEGEKNTKYFLGLEKRNKISSTINELITAENKVLTDPEDILLEGKKFYSALYKKDNNVTASSFYTNWNYQHATLSNDQRLHCEGLLTMPECHQVLLSMAKNKSPGSDGLPSEFYLTFWDSIGQLVVNSLNHAFAKGYLADEQGRAVISLIPKPGKDTRYLKNWRPIALLSTDYKIAAKCIASRMKGVLNSIVSYEQTGFLHGRFMGENIRLIQDLICYCDEKSIPGSLLFLDFEKAFDRLDWCFIQHTLDYLNFWPAI